MKTQKLTPRNTAPVKRDNVATVSLDANGIAPTTECDIFTRKCTPFASDGAE